jgi:hypothetical protein
MKNPRDDDAFCNYYYHQRQKSAHIARCYLMRCATGAKGKRLKASGNIEPKYMETWGESGAATASEERQRRGKKRWRALSATIRKG